MTRCAPMERDVRYRADACVLSALASLPKRTEGTMDERSRDVLAAADNWLTAIEAMNAADETQRGTEDQQIDLDDARCCR